MKKKKITKAKLKAREKRKVKREFKAKLESWKQAIILRDNNHCQMCGKDMTNFPKHCHHIVSFQSVKRNHPKLLEDINNGILICGYCHKFAPNSPHQGGFEFTLWLIKNKTHQTAELLQKLNKGITRGELSPQTPQVK